MPDLVLQVAHESRIGPPRLEVVKDLRQRSAHDPAPVRRQLVVRPERQPGPLDPGEIGGGAIEGHLLVVARPLRLAGGLARRVTGTSPPLPAPGIREPRPTWART